MYTIYIAIRNTFWLKPHKIGQIRESSYFSVDMCRSDYFHERTIDFS